ncbi:hypothetical protein GQ43DRAFT_382061 [Delitschia confertaspora ATCC 74209]|uniref:C2H2-type domain-containing protein n=1 Tax=Delitschia confertaspora ATCC 74209 TaxID=1513339 RepID=A0A9P4JCV2_9PLEO|nr:hypothetical protein GQ43DRAFT_382061 [Delitschia confertaspora ATCC 74209]
MQYGSNEYRFQSPPSSAAASNGARCTPKKQQQHSPALTNSPNGVALANPQPRAPHLTSPIVRVENYSGRESPVQSDISRPMSKRSHGSRRSANHLSPFPVDHSSDEDDTQPEQVRVSPVNIPTRRNDDGSWVPDGGTGQVGLSPDDRTALNNAWTPSIEEIAEQRLAAEKKAEVREWLSKSEMGSEVGDDPSSAGLLKPVNFKPNRPRARSHNDATRQGLGHNLGLGVHTAFDDSRIPGPGVYIEEPSEFGEYDYDDDEEEEGEGEDEDVRPESPPAEVDVTVSHQENSYFAVMLENGEVDGTIVHPWNDAPFEPSPSSTRYQPPTSNAAMMRYRERAKDVESASLAATLGSRRMSESDLGSIRAAPGVIKAIRSDSKKSKESRQRRLSFLDTLILKRTNSNLLKRKGSMPVQQSDSGQDKPKETLFEKPKRMGSWGRPKSPRLDTSVANQGKDIGLSSSTNLSATSGPWAQAKNAIRRSRSRSDLGKSPGLKELMTHHGGPPMPLLASPLGDTDATKPSPMPSAGEDDDEDGVQDHITMDLKVRSDPIIPTYEGFKTHARQLNPRLVDYMVDRITQEQMRRYKRLLEFKVKHLNAVENRNCASTKFCLALGGESKQLPPRAGNKDSEAPFIGFQITAPGSPQDDGEPPAEGTVVSAQFPSGVPLPPVKRLPAEFECPLCFKVKKFYKPSDWTKHVHEDVQPFTCTFPNCGEPKSFKRKADWVRHENERHRQLENWTCCIADCMHTCYRKDNFVQHLVREHKITEPRARTGRGGNNGARDASTNGDASWSGKKDASDDIWALVERCRRDTMKQPKNEPCRFCGNICNSWKKLTVHLAKHMEQISMPILPLVEQKQINAETVISPVVEIPEHSRLSTSPGKPVLDNPSRYNPPNSTFAPGLGSSFLQYPMDTSPSRLTASVTHTYPPPQLLAYRTQQQAQANYMPTPVQTTQNFLGQSYPGLHRPPKPRGAYVNELLIPNQQQPYLNGNIQSGPNQYPMTPISALGQEQQQPIFSTSPVETSFPADTLGSTYYTQEPQATSGAVTDMGYDTGSTMQNQLSAYQEMAALVAQERQRNHQYYSQ